MGRAADGRRRGVAIDPVALRKARLAAGLTQAQAAAGTMSKQALHLCEIGRNRPTRENLAAIVARLGVSLESVLADLTDPRAQERELVDLWERQRLAALEEAARRVLRDKDVRGRLRAVAHLYLGRAIHESAPADAIGELSRAHRQLTTQRLHGLAAEALEYHACALYLMQDPRAVGVARDALVRYRDQADRSPAVEARMLEHLGTFHLQRNQCEDAIACYREALQVSGALLDLARLANIYHGLAEACRRAGQVRQGLDYMERAISFYRSEQDVRGAVTDNLARAENDYGVQLMGVGRLERAGEMIQAALVHFAEAGVEAGRVHPLLSMGELELLRGDLDAATDWTCEGIDLAERQGAVVSLAWGYQQLGEVFALKGHVRRCEAAFSRALEILDAAALPERRHEALARYRRVRLRWSRTASETAATA